MCHTFNKIEASLKRKQFSSAFLACVFKIIKSCINFSNKTKNIFFLFSLLVQVQYGESDQAGVVDAFQYPGGRAGSPRPGHRCSKGTQSGLHNYNDTLPWMTAHLFNICHPV